jgi:hypothetical protein
MVGRITVRWGFKLSAAYSAIFSMQYEKLVEGIVIFMTVLWSARRYAL